MTTFLPFPFANAMIESKMKGSLQNDINFEKGDISKSYVDWLQSRPKKETEQIGSTVQNYETNLPN
jgi:hypothetical protein